MIHYAKKYEDVLKYTELCPEVFFLVAVPLFDLFAQTYQLVWEITICAFFESPFWS